MEAVKHGYEDNRRILVDGLPKAGLDRILPVDGAFYLYADVSRFSYDSFAFAKRMLEEAHVAATPGIDFDPLQRQPLRALLLRRLDRRHARGGGADRQMARGPHQLTLWSCRIFGRKTGFHPRLREGELFPENASELDVELLELVRLGLGGGDPFLHRRHRHDASQ